MSSQKIDMFQSAKKTKEREEDSQDDIDGH